MRKQNASQVEIASEAYAQARKRTEEARAAFAAAAAAQQAQRGKDEVHDELNQIRWFATRREVLEAEQAERVAGWQKFAADSAAAIASGDELAIAADPALAFRDATNLLAEAERCDKEALSVASGPFANSEEARQGIATASALRDMANQGVAMADLRLESGKAADSKLRNDRIARGEPCGALFPSRPGFTAGPRAWLSVLQQHLAEPPQPQEKYALTLASLDREENVYLAGVQRRHEQREAEARDAEAHKAEADRRFRAQTEANAAEARNSRERAAKQAAELKRLADAYRARMAKKAAAQ